MAAERAADFPEVLIFAMAPPIAKLGRCSALRRPECQSVDCSGVKRPHIYRISTGVTRPVILGRFSMSEIATPTFRLRLPDSEESEIVKVTFTPSEVARLRLFVDCSAALLRTSIVQRGFPTTIDVKYAGGQLAVEWTRPTDDEMAAYLHRYRPFGLKKESTYFDNIVNLLSKNVENSLFRSSLRTFRDMFNGKCMQNTKIKIESNDVILNCDDFFMDWLNAYQYHRVPDTIQRVDALHTILPLGFTEAFLMGLMSEKTGAISRVAHYAKAFIE
jgi:hypothetical protein